MTLTLILVALFIITLATLAWTRGELNRARGQESATAGRLKRAMTDLKAISDSIGHERADRIVSESEAA